jgi:hypothetical protein
MGGLMARRRAAQDYSLWLDGRSQQTRRFPDPGLTYALSLLEGVPDRKFQIS